MLFKVYYDTSINGRDIKGVSNVYSVRNENIPQFLLYIPEVPGIDEWLWVPALYCVPKEE